MRPTQAQAFHPENIPTAIAQCRPDGEVPVLERHFDGGQCRVYKVVFSNKESWAVRIPLHVQSSSKEAMIDVMKGELDTVLELNRKSFPWVAKYHGSSFTFENPVGYPFLAFSWLEGIPLPWSEPELPRPSRNKVLWQLAELQVTLIECTKEKRETATDFFRRVMNNRLRRVSNNDFPDLVEKDCWKQQALFPQVLDSELDNAPSAMDHGDLKPANIIVDSKLSIVGLIDPGFMQKVPMLLAGGLPYILRPPSPDQAPSQVLQEDRKVFIAALESLQPRFPQVVSWMLRIHCAGDVDYRACFLESIMSKGMHARLAHMDWKLPGCKLPGQQNGLSFHCD